MDSPTVDAYTMAVALEKVGKLGQQRQVLKKSVMWLPFIGVFLLKRGSIFIDRNNVDWKEFDATCKKLRHEKVPVSKILVSHRLDVKKKNMWSLCGSE